MLEMWLPILGGQVPSASEQTLAEDTPPPGTRRETPESSLIAVIRDISRPMLGLKAVHEGEVVRVFLIVGPDQVDDLLHAAALLEGYASILSENLNRATHFTAEAAQKESIHRLSWLRHHLNGPLGIASNALDDIRLYLKDNSQVGDQLVPNPELANKMSARPGRNLSDYTLRARLDIVGREINNLKGLSDRIRQLSEIGPDEPMSPVDLARLLRNRADRCRELVAGLVLHYDTCNQPVVIVGSERLLTGAFDELLFNACRELREHLVAEPCLYQSCACHRFIAQSRVAGRHAEPEPVAAVATVGGRTCVSVTCVDTSRSGYFENALKLLRAIASICIEIEMAKRTPSGHRAWPASTFCMGFTSCVSDSNDPLTVPRKVRRFMQAEY